MMSQIPRAVLDMELNNVRLAGIALLSLVMIMLSRGSALGKIRFSDDFESGNLHRWEAIGGVWEIIEVDGNHVVRTKARTHEKFLTLNIRNWHFRDFTMEARIWQVSLDQGANIYFHNDQSHNNAHLHSGYWFGVSGPFRAIGWGTIDDGMLRRWDTQRSAVPLNNWMLSDGADELSSSRSSTSSTSPR